MVPNRASAYTAYPGPIIETRRDPITQTIKLNIKPLQLHNQNSYCNLVTRNDIDHLEKLKIKINQMLLVQPASSDQVISGRCSCNSSCKL